MPNTKPKKVANRMTTVINFEPEFHLKSNQSVEELSKKILSDLQKQDVGQTWQ